MAYGGYGAMPQQYGPPPPMGYGAQTFQYPPQGPPPPQPMMAAPPGQWGPPPGGGTWGPAQPPMQPPMQQGWAGGGGFSASKENLQSMPDQRGMRDADNDDLDGPKILLFRREVEPKIMEIEGVSGQLSQVLERSNRTGCLIVTVNWDAPSILQYLRIINNAVDAAILAINMRFKGLMQHTYVQLLLVRSFTALAKALDNLRAQEAGCLCCLASYGSDRRIEQLATELYNKVGNVKANFKLSIDVSGSAAMNGNTSVSMDISAQNSYKAPSETTPALAPAAVAQDTPFGGYGARGSGGGGAGDYAASTPPSYMQ
jgi:hypothetical protein